MRGTIISLLLCLVALPASVASAAEPSDAAQRPAIAYLGVWEHKVDVVDLNKGVVLDQINVDTDVVRRLILTPDHKKLIVSTMAHNGFATIDLATRKVSDYFNLDHDNEQIRLEGDAIDPTGRYIYSIATTVTKDIDYYEISKPQFVVVDLQAKAIVRTADLPKGEEGPGYRGGMRVSPDGKYLYLFRPQGIQVFDTSDFKLIKTMDLKRPPDPDVLDLTFSIEDDPNEPAGEAIGMFRFTDPFIHLEDFGIGVINLSNLTYHLTPIGPYNQTLISPVMLNPEHTMGYTAVVQGEDGNRVTRFWAIDMKTRKIVAQREFTGRTRFNFGMSADGTKLLIYNAGYQIEEYDSKTLEMVHDIDLEGTTTSNLIVMPQGD